MAKECCNSQEKRCPRSALHKEIALLGNPNAGNNGFAGRGEGSFRSPYGTGPRGRGNPGYGQNPEGSNRFKNDH